MEKQIILIFGEPRHLPSTIDGIEIFYPYHIKTLTKEKYKLDTDLKVYFEQSSY